MGNASPTSLLAIRILAGANALVALVIVFATFLHKTRWEELSSPSHQLGGYEVDGWGSWAGPALLCVLAVLGLLTGMLRMISDPRGPDRSEIVRAAFLVVPAIPLFAGSALFANRYWNILLAGSAWQSDVAISIAQGLPVVRVAGWIGAALAGLLFGAFVWARSSMTRAVA